MTEFSEYEIKHYITAAMSQKTSDNLERCNILFHEMDEAQMQIEHGSSGQTRQEILDAYKKERRLYHAAVELVKRAGIMCVL